MISMSIWVAIPLATILAMLMFQRPHIYLIAALGQFAYAAVIWLQDHSWIGASFNVAYGLVFLWLWWKRGGKDKLRSLKAWGAKSLARLAKLARDVADRSIPRPVPQGA